MMRYSSVPVVVWKGILIPNPFLAKKFEDALTKTIEQHQEALRKIGEREAQGYERGFWNREEPRG